MYIFSLTGVKIMVERRFEKRNIIDIIVAFGSVLVLVILNLLFKHFGQEFFGGGDIIAGLADIFATVVSIGCPILILHFFTSKKEKILPYDEFSFRAVFGYMFLVLGIGYIFRICYAHLATFLSFIQPNDIRNKGFLVLFLYFVSSVVLPSILEEILYREKLFEIIFEQKLPALITVLLFAFSHSGIHSIVNAFIFGFLLQYVYLNSRRLGYCIFIHFINNLIAFLAAIADEGSILFHITYVIPYVFAVTFIIFAGAVLIKRKIKS